MTDSRCGTANRQPGAAKRHRTGRPGRNNEPVPPAPVRYNPRWEVAEQVAAVVRRRYGPDIRAIGVHGSLAHGDDTDGSDIDLVVVTRRPGSGPRPVTRRVSGVIVDLVAISGEEYLAHARTLTTSWPLAADQYLTTAALVDPDNWYGL